MGILDTFDPSCVIGLTLCIVFLALVLVWLSTNPDLATASDEADGQEAEPDTLPQTQTPQTTNEPPALNAWSAVYTGQQLVNIAATGHLEPEQAERFISLLEARSGDDPPRKQPRTHCVLCIIETCDQWGIPLDETRTIGRPKLCKKHRRFNLASAG